MAQKQIDQGQRLGGAVSVKNTGAREGQEVVQLYTRDPVASRSRPLRELKAFEKITLKPGETRQVTLRVPVESLGIHLDDGTYLVEAGAIQVFVGGSSLADPVGEAEILNTFRIPPMERRASASASVAQ